MWYGLGIGAVVVLLLYLKRRKRLSAENAADILELASYVPPEAVEQAVEAASEAAGQVVEAAANALDT